MNFNIGDVKKAINIVDLARKHGEVVKKGSKYWMRCPFHDEDTPSMTIDPEKNNAHCFGCAWNGDTIAFYQKLHGLDFRTALVELAAAAGLSDEPPDFAESERRRQEQRERQRQVEERERVQQDFERCQEFIGELCRLCYETLRTIKKPEDLGKPGVVAAMNALPWFEYLFESLMDENTRTTAMEISKAVMASWAA